MNKRLSIWLLALAGWIITTVIVLYAFRLSLFEILIRHQLDQQGIAVHSISITEASFNTLLLRDLSIGTGQELQADSILISWQARDLLAGMVDSVEISGLQVALDLVGESPPLGFLQSLLPATKKNTGAVGLPAISLRNSTIHLRSAVGNFAIALAGNIDQTQAGTQTANLDVEIDGQPGSIKSMLVVTLDAQENIQGKITVSDGELNLPAAQIASLTGEATFALFAMRPQYLHAALMLTDIHLPASKMAQPAFAQAKFLVQMDETDAQLTGELLTADGALLAHLHAMLRHGSEVPDIDLALTAKGAASDYPWPLLGLAQPSQGSIALEIKARAQIPIFQELNRNSLNDLGWLQSSTLTGQAQLELQGLDYPQEIAHLNGKLSLDAAFAEGSGKLDLLAEGNRLVAGPLAARQAAAALSLQAAFDQGAWRMGLEKPGQVTLDMIEPIDAIRLRGPLSLSISQLDIKLKNEPQGLAFNHHIVAAPTTFTLLVEQHNTATIEARVRPGKITLRGKRVAGEPYQGEGIIRGASLALLQPDIHLENISTTLLIGTTKRGKIADFTIGRLRHQAAAPFFAPISLSGSIKSKSDHGKPGGYSMSAVGGVPGTRYLRLTGEQFPDSSVGMLKIEIAPLTFSPAGLQPGMLLPSLAQLEDMSGIVSANVRFEWSKEGIHSRGTLDLDDVSFAYQTTQITGLNATLDLTDVLSPSSPPQQTLTIRRIDPGISMESLVASYQIEGSPPRINLEKAHLFMIGGIVSLEPTVIDPLSARNDVVILVDNIDLEVLFDLIEVEGLTGNGRLDGRIPLTLEDNQITIQNGNLIAEIPGMLRFQSEKASQLLAGAGKEMDMLLQAMQDFHYTELTLKLNKSAAHDLVATLSLLGNNPNVMDGQMFRLNINLESNLDKILEAMNQGSRLSDEVLRGLFR